MAYLHFFQSIQCTSCLNHSQFDLLHVSPEREVNRSEPSVQYVDSTTTFYGWFVCNTCGNPSFIKFRFKSNPKSSPHRRLQWLRRIEELPIAPNSRPQPLIRTSDYGSNLAEYCEVEMFYGSNALPGVPSDLPEDIDRFWREDVLKSSGSPRAIVIFSRTVLEAMFKDQGATSGNLQAKTKKMVGRGVITEELGEWADSIRYAGNDNVHDISVKVDAEDAGEIYAFARIIAELLYSYPARVRRIREKRDKAKQKAGK